MSSEHRSKILERFNGLIIGALFALLGTSLTGLYGVRGEMETNVREHSAALAAIGERLKLMDEMVAESSAAVERSADRVLRLESLDFRRTSTSIDRTSADRWHTMSLEARGAAASDLAGLAKYSEGPLEDGKAIVHKGEETLHGETTAWEALDRFVEQKVARQDDQESFAALDHALVEYRRLNGSHASVLSSAGADFFKKGSAENDREKQLFDEAIARSRSKLNLSVLGIVGAALGLSGYFLYVLWPRLRA